MESPEGVSSPSLADLPRPGMLIANQYRLIEVTGEGGMGVIYRARQESVGRDVAVKILRARFAKQEDLVRRFENEAHIISQLRHPNTIRLYDCQRLDDGSLFIVTEFLTGRSLLRMLREGPLPLDRIVHIVDQICGSLSEAHAAGIVHRDLKPENIFLDRVGAEDHVKVLDFGIAKLLQGEGTQTQPNVIMGTPAYMSPEQAAGEPADSRSDIYALGILLYQMLVGRPPFIAESPVALLLKQIREVPPPLTGPVAENVPPELESLLFDLLAKLPEHRPKSVDEVRARLRQIDLRAWSGPVRPATSGASAAPDAPLRATPLPFDAFAEPLAGHISLADEIPVGRTDVRLTVMPRYTWAKWFAGLAGAALGLFALVWLIASPQTQPSRGVPDGVPEARSESRSSPTAQAEPSAEMQDHARLDVVPPAAPAPLPPTEARLEPQPSPSPSPSLGEQTVEAAHSHVAAARGGARLHRRARSPAGAPPEVDPLGASISKLGRAPTASATLSKDTASAPLSKDTASAPPSSAAERAPSEEADEPIEDRPLEVEIE